MTSFGRPYIDVIWVLTSWRDAQMTARAMPIIVFADVGPRPVNLLTGRKAQRSLENRLNKLGPLCTKTCSRKFKVPCPERVFLRVDTTYFGL